MTGPSPSPYWYVVFPPWLIARGGGWDAFCAAYEESWSRTHSGLMGVIGFEVSIGFGPGEEVRRYTVRECAHLAHQEGLSRRVADERPEGEGQMDWQDEPRMKAAALDGISTNRAFPMDQRLEASQEATGLLRGLLVSTAEAIQKVVDLHTDEGVHECTGQEDAYPCETMRQLTEALKAIAGADD